MRTGFLGRVRLRKPSAPNLLQPGSGPRCVSGDAKSGPSPRRVGERTGLRCVAGSGSVLRRQPGWWLIRSPGHAEGQATGGATLSTTAGRNVPPSISADDAAERTGPSSAGYGVRRRAHHPDWAAGRSRREGSPPAPRPMLSQPRDPGPQDACGVAFVGAALAPRAVIELAGAVRTRRVVRMLNLRMLTQMTGAQCRIPCPEHE